MVKVIFYRIELENSELPNNEIFLTVTVRKNEVTGYVQEDNGERYRRDGEISPFTPFGYGKYILMKDGGVLLKQTKPLKPDELGCVQKWYERANIPQFLELLEKKYVKVNPSPLNLKTFPIYELDKYQGTIDVKGGRQMPLEELKFTSEEHVDIRIRTVEDASPRHCEFARIYWED